MSNIIDMREYREIDPILRKGDLVRVIEYQSPYAHCIDGLTGIVIEILETMGSDSEAPGQASWLTVAIPDEEGWVEYDLSLGNVVRILGVEADELRRYQVGSV
jgi:hypothetical protein